MYICPLLSELLTSQKQEALLNLRALNTSLKTVDQHQGHQEAGWALEETYGGREKARWSPCPLNLKSLMVSGGEDLFPARLPMRPGGSRKIWDLGGSDFAMTQQSCRKPTAATVAAGWNVQSNWKMVLNLQVENRMRKGVWSQRFHVRVLCKFGSQ